MAKGIFGGGYGSEDAPYLIEDVYDLRNTTSFPYKYYKLANDIDVNGSEFEESWTAVRFNGYLDGDGHKIRNIRIIGNNRFMELVGSGQSMNFTNCIFENIILQDTSIMFYNSGNTYPITFERCKFFIFFYNGGYRIFEDATKVNFCSFVISGHRYAISNTQSNDVLFYGSPFNYCNIYFDNFSLDNRINSVTPFILSSQYIKNTSIRGNIKIGRNSIIGILQNSYAAIEMKPLLSDYPDTKCYIETAPNSINFYDSELGGETVAERNIRSGSTLYALTTEQCKDADYLTSLGFLCRKA